METATYPNLRAQVEQDESKMQLVEGGNHDILRIHQRLKQNSERLACNQQRIDNARFLAEANELRVEAVRLLIQGNHLRAEAYECEREASSFADAAAFAYEISVLRRQAEDYHQQAERRYAKSIEILREAQTLRSRVVVILPQYLNH